MAVILEKRNLNGLVIDSTVEESHSVSSRITDHPISNDSPITDHMYREPLRLTLRGIIGATPPCDYLSDAYRPRALEQGTRVGVDNFGSSTTTIQYGQNAEPNSRLRAAWNRLIELQDNKEICQIVTGLKIYDDMVVESVETSQNFRNIDKLDFTVTLKQIRRVTAQEITVTPIGSKGVKDTGPKKPRCLRLNQVFTNNAAVTREEGPVDTPFASGTDLVQISVNGSAETQGQAGVYSPFNQTTWNSKICKSIQARFLGKPQKVETPVFATLPTVFGGSSRVQVGTETSNVRRTGEDLITNFASNACAAVLRLNPCKYSAKCNETVYDGRLDTSNEDNDVEELRNVEESSLQELVREATRDDRNIISRTLDPTGQIFSSDFLNRGLSSVATQLRLSCYQRAIIEDLESLDFSGDDLDEYIEDVRTGRVGTSFPLPELTPAPPPQRRTQ